MAWALGINWKWFSDEPRVAGYYWIPGVPREWTFESLKQTFRLLGYAEETTDRSLEPGFEKIAFHCDIQGIPCHFSRQLTSGAWTSKMGRLNDIEHVNLECIESYDVYGPVCLLLKRRIDVKAET